MWSTIAKLLLATATLSAAERIKRSEPHMGTMFRIVLYADNADQAAAALRAAFERIAELDGLLSDYRPDSELNRVCREAVGRDLAISHDLYTVLEASQKLSERTDGAFDVTVGPAVREWRTARKTGRLPEPAALSAVMQRTGFRKLHLGAGTVRLDQAEMQLDLGAIAKGYAADEALALLRERGFPQALVAASGDIALGDSPPGKPGWDVGVDSLNTPKAAFSRVLQLSNTAVSTSGDTEQFVLIGGVRYSHIVNPKTGMGLMQRIGVTVTARRAIDSDSWATALSVVTEQRGREAALALLRGTGAKGTIEVLPDTPH